MFLAQENCLYFQRGKKGHIKATLADAPGEEEEEAFENVVSCVV